MSTQTTKNRPAIREDSGPVLLHLTQGCLISSLRGYSCHMETKSAVIGAGATVLLAGGLFFGIGAVNAASGSSDPAPSPSVTQTATPTPTPTQTVSPSAIPTQEPVVTEAPAPVEQPAPAPAPAPAPVYVAPAPAPAAPVDSDGYITGGTSGGGSAGPGKVDLSTPPADGSQVILNPTAGDPAQPPAPSAGK